MGRKGKALLSDKMPTKKNKRDKQEIYVIQSQNVSPQITQKLQRKK